MDSKNPRSMLDSFEIGRVFEASAQFVEAYCWMRTHPNNHMGRARTLSALGQLEEAVDDHVVVSRETVEKELDDGSTEEPPF